MNSLKMLLLIGFTPLMACSHSQDSNDNPAYAPVINPHPQYFMTVKGSSDPTLFGTMPLEILFEYQANNPICKYTINRLEGVYAAVYRDMKLLIHPDFNGKYSVTIPLDYYLPGKCQWGIESMQYQIKGSGYSRKDIAVFSSDNTIRLPKDFQFLAASTIACDINFNCSWTSHKEFGFDLPRNRSYTFVLNLKRK